MRYSVLIFPLVASLYLAEMVDLKQYCLLVEARILGTLEKVKADKD